MMTELKPYIKNKYFWPVMEFTHLASSTYIARFTVNITKTRQKWL